MPTLDSLDRRILYELDLNSRQPIADLSRTLHLSRDRILYRIKKLQSDGILLGFSTAANVQSLGLFVYKTYLRLEKDQRSVASFVEFLHEHPLVSWIGEADGRWDILFGMYARNPSEFHAEQSQILHKFSPIIDHFSVYTMVDSYCFHKNFLVDKRSEYFYFGGAPGDFRADSTDIEILRLLSEDSRLSKSELGVRLGLNPMAVKYRIDKLEEHGIILGYPIAIDHSKIGMLFFKLQIYFGAYNAHSERELIAYCKDNRCVTFFIRQIGDCTHELELLVESYEHLHEIIGELRHRFSGFIRSIDPLFIRKQRYKWVPFAPSHLEREPRAAAAP